MTCINCDSSRINHTGTEWTRCQREYLARMRRSDVLTESYRTWLLNTWGDEALRRYDMMGQ